MVSNVLNHQDMLLDDHKNVFSSPGAWDDGFPELGFGARLTGSIVKSVVSEQRRETIVPATSGLNSLTIKHANMLCTSN